jgi:anti-sigma factor RsiW
MSHLGRWISAQVDGELAGIERDRILNHIAGCDACREEANTLRALKRRMTELGDSANEESIAGRIIELGRTDQDFATQIFGPPQIGRTAWQPPPAELSGWPKQSRLNWRVATGSAGTVLLTLGVLAFLLGGTQPDSSVPRVTPAVDAYWKQHSYDTGQAPAAGVGASNSSTGQGSQAGQSGPTGPGRLILPATQSPSDRSLHPSSP